MSGRTFFAELRRRNVLRAGAFYLAGAWLLVQVAGQLLPLFHAPEWTQRWIVIALAFGFPLWLLFAWFYEITPDGIRRESEVEAHESITHVTGRRLDAWIIGILAVAVVLLLTDRFVLRQRANEEADAAVSDQSVAVLPFVDMSQAKDQEYFSDGISEELLNLLAKIPQLRVAARTSSFSFKGRNAPIPEIAKRLLVAHVLEGSIRKSGDQLRITAQLIRAADGYHVWSETYDRRLDDIFKIQDEIAGKVVEQLKVRLLGAGPKAQATDPNAYALYLQAGALGRQKTAEAYAKSDALYDQVLAIDPRYAPALTGRISNLLGEMSIGVLSGKDGFPRAHAAAARALEIDPDSTRVHIAAGRVAVYEGDLGAGARAFERAAAIEPTDQSVLVNCALMLQTLGRLDEALVFDRAIVLRDPVAVSAFYNLATDLYWSGRLDEAIAAFRTVLNLSPNRTGTHAAIAQALMVKGDAAAALAEVALEPPGIWRLASESMASHALGRTAEADKALAEMIATYAQEAPYNIAYVYAFRGEADKAFEWLDKAVDGADPGLSEIVVENLFDPIHGDARWLPFLRRIGKAPDQLAAIAFEANLPDALRSEAAAAAPGAAEPAP